MIMLKKCLLLCPSRTTWAANKRYALQNSSYCPISVGFEVQTQAILDKEIHPYIKLSIDNDSNLCPKMLFCQH